MTIVEIAYFLSRMVEYTQVHTFQNKKKMLKMTIILHTMLVCHCHLSDSTSIDYDKRMFTIDFDLLRNFQMHFVKTFLWICAG